MSVRARVHAHTQAHARLPWLRLSLLQTMSSKCSIKEGVFVHDGSFDARLHQALLATLGEFGDDQRDVVVMLDADGPRFDRVLHDLLIMRDKSILMLVPTVEDARRIADEYRRAFHQDDVRAHTAHTITLKPNWSRPQFRVYAHGQAFKGSLEPDLLLCLGADVDDLSTVALNIIATLRPRGTAFLTTAPTCELSALVAQGASQPSMQTLDLRMDRPARERGVVELLASRLCTQDTP